MKPLKILFFVSGPAPSPEQLAEANLLNAQICFRNATVIPAEAHSLEECDGVAGDVPPIYAAAYPPAEAAIEARAGKIAALAAKVGDAPAPQPPAKGAGKAKDAPKPADDAKAPEPPASTAPAGASPGWTPNGGK